MKRSEDSFSLIASKRPKLQEDIDDIWGDDPGIEEIDRCVNWATQICSQSIPNHAINNTLTSYDNFKNKQGFYASTQAFLPPTAASTSGFVPRQVNQLNNSVLTVQSSGTVVTRDASDDEIPKLLQKIQTLESDKKKLTEMYETKNGEITILRSKLNQSQKAVDSEKMEKLRIVQENQQNWNCKLTDVNKEIGSLKCELELKNLEIANQREKLCEIKKVYNSNLNMSILNGEMSQIKNFIPKIKINGLNELKKQTFCKSIQTEMCDYPYPIIPESNYPLQSLIPKSVFEKCQEKSSLLKLENINKNSLSSYRHNFAILFGGNSAQNSSKTEENNLICLNNLYPEIQKLLRCTEEELNNSLEVSNFIQNILNATKNSLLCLLKQLQKFNQKLSYDDVENMNKLYLEQHEIQYQSVCIFSGILWHENETAVDIRRYLAILSSLVFHYQKLCNYFTTPSNLMFNEMQMEVDPKSSDYEFLNLLLEVTTIIKNIRRSEQFCGILSAILKLLSNLSSKGSLPPKCCEIINQIFKQIIFSRPSKPILKYVCEFLKYMSCHKLFIEKLCSLNKCEGTQSSVKDGFIFFSEDFCTFRILGTELETCDLNTEVAIDVIKFLNYSVTCNVSWMFQEEQRCKCVEGLYSLSIDILFNTLQKHAHNKDKTHHTIFKTGLILLDILTVRIPDLIYRCTRYISQYQTIIKYISKIQKDLSLAKAHETALENLVSQLNNDVQKPQNNNKIIATMFNSTSF